MFDDLLAPAYPVNEGPPDATDINQVILYFSDEEIKLFRARAKAAMKQLYPGEFHGANLSDLLLKLLEPYGSDKT
jgi:hypothetical protein